MNLDVKVFQNKNKTGIFDKKRKNLYNTCNTFGKSLTFYRLHIQFSIISLSYTSSKLWLIFQKILLLYFIFLYFVCIS